MSRWDECFELLCGMRQLCCLLYEGLLHNSNSITFTFLIIFVLLAINGNLCTEKILLTATALYFCWELAGVYSQHFYYSEINVLLLLNVQDVNLVAQLLVSCHFLKLIFSLSRSVILCREWCLFSAVVSELWDSARWAIFPSHLFCSKCFRFPGIFPKPISIKICQEQFKQTNLASNVSDYSEQLHFGQKFKTSISAI